MTIVVTTASTLGITVVGDRALTRRVPGQAPQFKEVTKVYFATQANISFAFWGRVNIPGQEFGSWAQGFVSGLAPQTTLRTATELLANELRGLLEPVTKSWGIQRRGVHVAGFVDGVPHIYHVHTGDPQIAHHPPRAYFDFPHEHTSGDGEYQEALASGKRAQLRNGQPGLFVRVAASFEHLRSQLEEEFGVRIPAPTLAAQLAMDRAFVRFAAGMLAAADQEPTVSEEVDCLAFTATGR
jgi:hypothetical protein